MTDATSTEELMRRIERIERQNRTLRRFVTTLAVLGVVGAVGLTTYEAASQQQQATPGRGRAVVEGDRFVLRNAEGRLVGAFGVNSEGTANLILLDKTEKVRATIGVNANGDPAFVFLTQAGKQRLTMADTASGPAMILMDKDEKVRTVVAVDGEAGVFQIIDPNGNATWNQR
jgi:hypothetical protein